jgi:hypothetical protein
MIMPSMVNKERGHEWRIDKNKFNYHKWKYFDRFIKAESQSQAPGAGEAKDILKWVFCARFLT